jgi:hypothetical protein
MGSGLGGPAGGRQLGLLRPGSLLADHGAVLGAVALDEVSNRVDVIDATEQLAVLATKPADEPGLRPEAGKGFRAGGAPAVLEFGHLHFALHRVVERRTGT